MLKKYASHTVLALAFALALAPAVVAQESEPQAPGQFGEKIDVNEVLLDVLVTDSKGNVIVGLKPEDFVVKENGKPVELTGLTFYSDRRLIGGAREGVKVDEVPEDRFFILFFDDQKDEAVDATAPLSPPARAPATGSSSAASPPTGSRW